MRIGWLWVAALLASGCVAKSKYVELESQLDKCRERASDRRDRPPTENNELAAQLKPLVDKGLLAFDDLDGRTVIGMKAEVLFPSGSAALSSDGRGTVAELGRILGRVSDANWQVEGHTDTEPISTAEFPSNWHLGAARALSVLEVLIASGMRQDQLSAATFGQTVPVASNATTSGKAENRRIELVLLPEIRKTKMVPR